MIKKIALVRPGHYPEGLIIPLSLLYLASYLRKHTDDIEFKVIDAPLDDLSNSKVAELVHQFAPDLVALTGLSFHTPYVKEAAREIRKILPQTPIVVGGAGVSSDPGDVLKETSISYGVIREGEETFLKLVEALNANEDPLLVSGLAYKNKEGKLITNPEQPLIQEMDDIPFPAYDLIDVEKYFQSKKRTSQSPVFISKRLLPILTSRGCPFKCVFCHDTLGKDFRHRSPDNIVNEIVWLKEKYNFEELEIVDDIFNFDLKHAKEVFRKLIANDLGLKIAFPNGIKYEMIDTELLQLFKKGSKADFSCKDLVNCLSITYGCSPLSGLNTLVKVGSSNFNLIKVLLFFSPCHSVGNQPKPPISHVTVPITSNAPPYRRIVWMTSVITTARRPPSEV